MMVALVVPQIIIIIFEKLATKMVSISLCFKICFGEDCFEKNYLETIPAKKVNH